MSKALSPLELTKESEALKRFKNNIRWLEENTSLKHYFENDELHFKEDLDTIEERLDTLEEDFMSLTETNMELVEEQARNQRKLKALDAIKETFDFGVELGQCPDGTVVYRLTAWCKGSPVIIKPISKEKYELLKEELL